MPRPTPAIRAEQLAAAAARRSDVYDLIVDSLNGRGYPPSVSELADQLNVSKVLIRRDLKALAGAGKIEVDPGVARGIRLT